MNFKHLMKSSCGLAIANTIFTHPASLLLQLPQRCHKNLPHLKFNIPIIAILTTILYTRYYHPQRMTHLFIFKSMLYMQFISMLISGAIIVFHAAQRAEFMFKLSLFSTHTKDCLLSTPINFTLQIIVWYLVIFISNRVAVLWFLKSENK